MKNMKKHLTVHNIFRIIAWVIGGVMLAVLIAFLFGLAVMYLWNWLMPTIFGLGTITYWQAFGIVVLAKLLFGGLGGHGGHDHDGKKCHDDHHRFQMKFEKSENGYSMPEDQMGKYQEFWEAEGKEAFEKYCEKKKTE